MRRRRLFSMRQGLPGDIADVLKGAALLKVTRFELFRIAYRRWFGFDLQDRVLKRSYLPYMFRSQVPPWVRKLTRS